MNGSRAAALVAALSVCAPALAEGRWWLARNSHFEIYSSAGPERAEFTLTRFEELRLFFNQNSLAASARNSRSIPPLRVLEFENAKQEEALRLHPVADAYFSALGARNYIVKPIFAVNDFGVAAHEYAHYILHSGGLTIPHWLREGLAELASTAAIKNQRCELGGPLPARLETLRRLPWMSASELWSAEPAKLVTRQEAAVFYAQSWALTDMFTSAPEYAPRFGELLEMLSRGASVPNALLELYRKSPEALMNDARQWVRHGGSPRRTLPPLTPEPLTREVTPLTQAQAQAVIADALLTEGQLDRADSIYRELLRRTPHDPNVLAALGTVALRKNQPREAADYWREALSADLKDAELCYRYAELADWIDLPPEQVARSLEQAIALREDFDDARFHLAQLRGNQGDYRNAAMQFQAMRVIPPTRAFAYWAGLSEALSELGKREEAQAAAQRAKTVAANPAEHARADRLAFVAATDFGVQFTRGQDGSLKLVTTRVPHGVPAPNPFIEARDRIRVISGTLREVQCRDDKLTGFVVSGTLGAIFLDVPDPARVLIRKGPSVFTCGAQTEVTVTVEYAAGADLTRGILRGLEY